MKKVLNKFVISGLTFLSCCAFPNDFNSDKQIAKEIISKNESIRSFIKDDNGNLYVITTEKTNEKSIIKKISTDNSISTIYQTDNYIEKVLCVKNELYFSMKLDVKNDNLSLYKINLDDKSHSLILILDGKSNESIIDGDINVAKMSSLINMDYDEQDNIYFLDIENKRNYRLNLRKLDLLNNKVNTIQLIDKIKPDDPLWDLNEMNFMIDKQSKEIYITGNTSLPSSDNESANTLFKIDKNGLIDRIKIIYKDPVFLYKIDELGNLYITTRTVRNRSNFPKIVKVNKDGSFVELLTHSNYIQDVVIDNKNQLIYILDGENRIFKIPLKEKN